MVEFYRITEEQAEENALVIAYHEDKSLIGKRALLLDIISDSLAYVFLSKQNDAIPVSLHHCMTVKDYKALPEKTIIRPGKNKTGVDGLMLVHN